MTAGIADPSGSTTVDCDVAYFRWSFKMTKNDVYGVSLEAVQKSEENMELKQNQVYGIHAGHQQQGSEDILVQPNVV